MRIAIRAIVAAVLVLSFSAAVAGARDGLAFSPTTTTLTFARFEFSGGLGVDISCPVTLALTLHASVSKSVGALAGQTNVTAGTGRCSEGNAGLLVGGRRVTGAQGPYHLTYSSFSGTLPNISSVTLRVNDVAFWVTSSPAECLTQGAIDIAGTTTGGNPATGLSVSATGIPLTGNFLCTFASGSISGAGSLSPSVRIALIGREEAPPPDPIVVTVGDSFISGEGGRWAGNTATRPNEAIDRLGGTAYFDNGENNGELIRLCHRSKSAEAYIGALTDVTSLNLACSGATTRTDINDEGDFKPGLDFYDVEGRRGQALMLQEFAEANPRAIKLVAISIGGNDFHFGDIIKACVTNVIFWGFGLCSEEEDVTEYINEAAIAANTTAIKEGILEVRRAMEEAGYGDETYTLLIQNYPAPIPSVAGIRYGIEQRWEPGGCPIFDADVNWAIGSVLPAVNEAVWAAVAATGLANTVRLELLPTFNGRRLCEAGVGLLEEKGLDSWMDEGAIDETEWITQIRTWASEPFTEQEGFHPNYWGQKALRSCLRLAYNEGAPIEGTCQIAGSGKTALEEPRMRLN